MWLYVEHVTNHAGRTLSRHKLRDADVPDGLRDLIDAHDRVVLVRNGQRWNYTKEEC